MDHGQEGPAALSARRTVATLGFLLSVATLAYVVQQLLQLVSGPPPSVTVYALFAVLLVVGLALLGLGPFMGLIASVQLARGKRSATPLFVIAFAATTVPVFISLLNVNAGGKGQGAFIAGCVGIMAVYGLLALTARRMAKRGELR